MSELQDQIAATHAVEAATLTALAAARHLRSRWGLATRSALNDALFHLRNDRARLERDLAHHELSTEDDDAAD